VTRTLGKVRPFTREEGKKVVFQEGSTISERRPKHPDKKQEKMK